MSANFSITHADDVVSYTVRLYDGHYSFNYKTSNVSIGVQRCSLDTVFQYMNFLDLNTSLVDILIDKEGE